MPKAVKKKSVASARLKQRKPGKSRSTSKKMDAVPETEVAPGTKVPARIARSSEGRLQQDASKVGADPEVLNRLWSIIEARRNADPIASHSARLLSRGAAKVAQKFGEEAMECLIEVVAGNRTAAIAESADVLYHLLVMWVQARIRPDEVWSELEKREGAAHLGDGPNGPARQRLRSAQLGTSKIP